MNNNHQPSLFDNDPTVERPAPQPLTANDELSLLALSMIEGAGFGTVRGLFSAFHGQLSAVWEASSEDLQTILHRARIPQPTQVIQQIKARPKELVAHAKERQAFLKDRRNITLVLKGTDAYPESLLSLRDAPAWLFVEGNVDVLHRNTIVAVIGTRSPTTKGVEAATRLSTLLVRWGYTVLSGLAEGIDAVGHQTAIDYDVPTIAVLGHGIDVIFPAATSGLRRRIVEQGGAVISEYLPGDSYTKERFVQRNRIQAALAHAVAVVEGQSKSGTAHTVRFARQLKRPLFGVTLNDIPMEPQGDLLLDLLHDGAPVFDLEQRSMQEQLRDYLEMNCPRGQQEQMIPGQLFRSQIKEIRRLATQYGASPEDFKWLTRELRKVSQELEGN